jgi:hypothetical protein
MNSFSTFWANHGTKVLGYIIAINSGIAVGGTALPPPLDTHATVIKAWALFINFILGGIVVARGYGNTTAIATQVTQQNMDKMVTAAKTGVPAVAAAAGSLAPGHTPPGWPKTPPAVGKVGGYARPMLLLLVTLVAGCAALGLTTPQSPQQSIAYGYSGVTAALTTLASLTTQGVISSADSIKANNAILAVKTLLDQANAFATSSAPLATTILTTATADLAQVSLYLTCKQQKGSTPCQL